MPHNQIPSIGIFDSGVGGLTVFKEIKKHLPFVNLVYLGDTARLPYGSKSQKTIIEYSIQNCEFLLKENVSAIVVACNTASALALDTLQKTFSIPFYGVITMASQIAVQQSKRRRVGVIGTKATIKSKAFAQTIAEIDKDVFVESVATPLLVPIVEESLEAHPITKTLLQDYLSPILEADIDTLILGCTHYPLLRKVLEEVVGTEIVLVDCATALAKSLKKDFNSATNMVSSTDKIYVTDDQESFLGLATKILDNDTIKVKKIHF